MNDNDNDYTMFVSRLLDYVQYLVSHFDRIVIYNDIHIREHKDRKNENIKKRIVGNLLSFYNFNVERNDLTDNEIKAFDSMK